MNVKGKQIENGTLTQNLLNITVNTITEPTSVTTKTYVDALVNSAHTSISNNLSNLNMVALATTSGNGYMLACDTAILVSPLSVVSVMVNGIEVNVGVDCAFSGDNGVTFRESGAEVIGDKLYWNTNLAPFQLDGNDEIDFAYLSKKIAAVPAFSFDITVTDNDAITLPTAQNYQLSPNYTITPASYNAVVDWGDNTTTNLTAYNVGHEHTYATAGTYTIKITGVMDVFSTMDSDNTMISSKIVKINSCGDIDIKNVSFSGCAGVTSIPADFFKYNINLPQAEYVFQDCANITTIPAGLFDTNVNIVSFASCFRNCNNTNIPVDLFKYNVNAIIFSSCFYANKMITIPADLFKYNVNAVDFNACFTDCTNLNSIPSNLFTENTAAVDFSSCFAGCTSITSIPVGLFTANTLVTKFEFCFRYVQMFTIPPTLFSTNTQVTSFQQTFYECFNLTAIPANLFANNTLANDFTMCFYGDSSIDGNVPELWVSHPTANGIQCFRACNNIDNYASIPADWK